jgi:hypothetical protein
MKPMGWVFLLASLSFVWGLVIYCFYRVLTLPPEEEAAPEEVQQFRSA